MAKPYTANITGLYFSKFDLRPASAAFIRAAEKPCKSRLAKMLGGLIPGYHYKAKCVR